MGKKRRSKPQEHKQNLGEQLEDPASFGVRAAPRAEKKRKRDERADDEVMGQKMSSRILKEARAQQSEVDAELALEEQQQQQRDGIAPIQLDSRALTAVLARLDDSDDDDSGASDGGASIGGISTHWKDDEPDITPEEEAALAAFMAPGASHFQQRNLADAVLAKVREAQQAQGLAALPGPGEEPLPQGLDDQVVEVYRGVGQLLARYSTGKLPRAFKIIPNLKDWEGVLHLTDPEKWTPHAMYQATRLFVSNLNARLAQRFLSLVLLPRVRADIRQHQRLHFALFQALRKATYKPGAFFKGILLPLCATRTCTLREAVILSSVIKRASLPALHSAAALLRLADFEYCGTTSFFIRVLLDKKYALPFKVVDALSAHFCRFADDERTLPVVWHQALLCFVQRYKHELRAQDAAALRGLCASQAHYQVTPEVLRELDAAAGAQATPGAGPAAMAVDGCGGSNGAGRLGSALAQQRRVPGAGSGGAPGVGRHVCEDVRNLPAVLMLDEDD